MNRTQIKIVSDRKRERRRHEWEERFKATWVALDTKDKQAHPCLECSPLVPVQIHRDPSYTRALKRFQHNNEYYLTQSADAWMEYKELTEKIIGCAYRVYNKMGFGYLESVYEKCMLIELRKAGFDIESQKPIRVQYDAEVVGDFIADILVNDTVILELKSVRKLVEAHEVQLVNYLVATGKPVGLLFNFGETKVGVKRKVKDLP